MTKTIAPKASRKGLTREVSAQRNAFAENRFRSDPDFPIPKINDEIEATFGVKMRPHQLYALRKKVRDALGMRPGVSYSPPPTPMGRAARPEEGLRVELNGTSAIAYVPPQEVAGVEHTLQLLQQIGVTVATEKTESGGLVLLGPGAGSKKA
jgi:hypothetical protein